MLPTKKSTHLQRPRLLPRPNNNQGSLQEIPIGTIQEQRKDDLFAAEQRLENELEEKENQKSFVDHDFSATLNSFF